MSQTATLREWPASFEKAANDIGAAADLFAERPPNPEAVIKKLGTVGVQPKYDGVRVQIHKAGDQVSLFSRNLESMTEVWLEPAIVVEVLADEITPSPRTRQA
jgi:ATP-dependent DNA ligase